MTTLMRTSLPAWERSFPSHPCNFLHTLSLIQSKLALFPFLVKEGNPKYFSQCRISRTPRILLMICLLASVTDLLKNRAILSLLIFQPETSSYTDNRSITLLHSVELALQNRRLSSAKNKWVSLGPCLHKLNPVISPLLAALFIRPRRPSVHKRNRNGERQSPCLRPLEGWIKPFGSPFTSMEQVTVLTHTMIRPIHCSQNPIFLITFSKNTHSTLTYALLISNFKAINPFEPELQCFMVCKVSKAMRILSVMRRPLAKVDQCSVIILLRNFLSLLARTLEKIL